MFIDYVFEKYLTKGITDKITFKILGGEILLEPSLVDKIISYINFKTTITYNSCKIAFTTNGTLFNNIFVKNLLEKWKDIISFSNISFDGSPINQDINRTFKDGTGSTASILNGIRKKKEDFILNDMHFNYTIAKSTMNYVNDSLSFFVKYFFNLMIGFEIDFLIGAKNELKILVEKFYEIEYLSVKANKLNIRDYSGSYTDVINKDEKKHEGKFCYKLVLTEDGDITPCVSYAAAINKKLALSNIDDLTSNIDLQKLQLKELDDLLSLLNKNKINYQYCPVYLLIALKNYEIVNKEILSTTSYFKDALKKITKKLLILCS
jgi:sulfatase maturation enzyme AslB (radical SAM superfamily)